MSAINEFMHRLAWIHHYFELAIIAWFLITQFPKHQWSLFTAHHQQLNSMQQHEMHSCFITIVIGCFFHMLSREVELFLLAYDIEHVMHIKIFYVGLMIYDFIYILTLYIVHRLKGCLFSKATRIVMYMLLIFMGLLFMQLIARGYFDYHELKIFYKVGGFTVNTLAVLALSIYPIRQTLKYFAERRERACE